MLPWHVCLMGRGDRFFMSDIDDWKFTGRLFAGRFAEKYFELSKGAFSAAWCTECEKILRVALQQRRIHRRCRENAEAVKFHEEYSKLDEKQEQ